MDWPIIIAFSAAIVSGGIALGVSFSARSLIHWIFAAGLLLLAAESVMVGLSLTALVPEHAAMWQFWRLFLFSMIPGVWLVFSATYARQNMGELLQRRRWFWAAGLLVPLLIGVVFRNELLAGIASPVPGEAWRLALGRAGMFLDLWGLVGGILVLMNLERTYRAAVGTMRWRIKYMVIGLGALFALRAFTASQAILFKSINLSLQVVNSGALLIACAVIGRTLLRTGHFQVGVYASQSVLQSSFTILLAGVYLVLVGGASKITESLGTESAFELKAFLTFLSLVLLSVLLLSDRLRLRARRFISHHFHRPMYDFRSIWRTFTERTLRCTDQAALSQSVVNVVSEVFQALSVGLWVVDESRQRLVLQASTSVSAVDGRMDVEGAEAAAIIHALEAQPEPVDIDASKASWVIALQRSFPSQFPRGGNRVCVPIATGKQLLGFLAVGDRVAGLPYSIQDFELLKAISDQSAASLLNLQLLERLSQSKQLEAFQAMSAFFVHDLKNTASTLALMLKNFPLHYQNPAFREDALRGISKTVTHLNDLIARLNMLRHELVVHAVECDLNDLVSDVVKAQQTTGNVQFVKELDSIPKIQVDPQQIEKVMTNLVLNAKHAVGSQGNIRIQTNRLNGWVVVGVSDTGCGMSQDFIRHSLFRPFQSTKKDGLGIGMFHCKLIVEAHRGRIEVESQPGAGTTFRVLLPVTAS